MRLHLNLTLRAQGGLISIGGAKITPVVRGGVRYPAVGLPTGQTTGSHESRRSLLRVCCKADGGQKSGRDILSIVFWYISIVVVIVTIVVIAMTSIFHSLVLARSLFLFPVCACTSISHSLLQLSLVRQIPRWVMSKKSR